MCSTGLGSWELLLVLLEKSVDSCQGCEWVCGAVQVWGCWQKGNFRLWAVVTQQSLNPDCGTGSVTAWKMEQLLQLQLLSSQLTS